MTMQLELTAATAATAAPPARRRLALGRVLVATDVVANAMAWCVAGPVVLDGRRSSIGLLIVLACGLTPLAMAGLGLYRSLVCTAFVVELTRTIMAVGATLTMMLLAERAGVVQVDGVEAAWTSAVSAGLLLVGRRGFRAWVTAERAAGRYHRPLVLVGRTTEVLELLTFYTEHPELGYRVEAIVGDEPGDLPGGLRWLGSLDDAAALASVAPYGGAVLAMSGLPSAVTNHLLRRLTLDGVNVHLHTGLTRIRHGRLRALPLAHEPLHYFASDRLPRLRHHAKRAIDLAGAALALVLASPVLLAAVVLVRLEDGGPALFRQRRVGVGGREFEMLKLRTMVPDAEDRRDALLDRNLRTGPLFKVDDDPRITRVGRWLRALSVDELPQLVNVLRGEMSLVGPRPALPAETALFDDELQRRHDVRPGMTGLWQVEARDNPSIYLYRNLDLFYVENWTLAGDVSILARTAGAVLVKGGRQLVRGERR
jgi:exopolysaccharide biosynthesis polyprenyl glycosylphosphotransferase